MSDDQKEIAFGEALDKLLTEEQVPIHLLYRLSDLNDEDRATFDSRWLDVDEERRREIVRHLVDITEEDFVVDFYPIFESCLSDPYPTVRIASLDGLWDATDTSLVKPIITMLEEDPEAEVQAAAAGSLAHYLLMSAWGQLKGVPTEKIVDTLMDRYRSSDSELVVRRVCLEALGSVKSPEVSQAIEEAYESSQRDLQLSAIFAMGNSADPRWLSIVLDEMESPYEDMRLEAARAAGNIGHTDAITPLAGLAYDESEEVAIVAIAALGEVGGDTAREVLMEMSEDIDLDDRDQYISEALEESSWSDLNLQFSLFTEDSLDEEE